MTSIGKFRHLQRCSTDAGHFVIMAIDHRTNLLEKLNQSAPAPYSDADFVEFKQLVMRSLAEIVSATLVDPAYGIAVGTVSGVLHGKQGLLSPIEVTDYSLHPSQREMQAIDGWSVEKMKRSGCDGVKLLLPYHPAADNAAAKHAFVQQTVAACAQVDLPFFLEPIPYALDPSHTLPNDELLQISIEMCQRFSDMGVDVLKLPFPVDAKQSTNADEWQNACNAVNNACAVPWALLSAGVSFEVFERQAQVACRAGASGVIVGRAVWAEAVTLQADKRLAFLQDVAPQRMQALANICAAHAMPWHQKVAVPDTRIDWYRRL